MSVKKLTLRSHTHRVKPQQDALEHLCGIELPLVFIKILILLLDKGVKVGKNGVVRGGHPVKRTLIADPPFCIKFL